MRNLTEVSLNNRPLVWYFIVVAFIGGQRDVASSGRDLILKTFNRQPHLSLEKNFGQVNDA